MKTSTKWLLVLALLATGCATESAQEPAADAAPIVFEDATAGSGLAGFVNETGERGDAWFPETMGGGLALTDLDGDGADDVVLIGGGSWDAEVEGLSIYLNQGDGTFAQFPSEQVDGVDGYGFGVVAGDVDADGDEDLYVTTLERNVLLRNDGGAFTDITDAAGVAGPAAWSTAALFFDADRDGDLDLLVGNYVSWTPETDIYCSQDGENKGYCTPELYEGLPMGFYLNRGDGSFEDQSDRFAGSRGKTLGLTLLDFNRDGVMDVAAANDTEPDELWQGFGDGTFEEIGVASGIAFDERGRARAGMGIDAGVMDETGETTLFVGNFSGQMLGVYRHLNNDVFLDRAAVSRIGRPSLLTLAFGLVLLDAELDGDLDVFVANGHVQPQIERVSDAVRYRQPPQLFANLGSGMFEERLVIQEPLLARGAAAADLDRDGDVDLLVTQNGGPVRFYRNETNGRSVQVRVDGAAIGTRLELTTPAGRQVRWVRSGGSYLSQSSLEQTFGLGAAARADSLVVYRSNGSQHGYADVVPGAYRVSADGDLIAVQVDR